MLNNVTIVFIDTLIQRGSSIFKQSNKYQLYKVLILFLVYIFYSFYFERNKVILLLSFLVLFYIYLYYLIYLSIC